MNKTLGSTHKKGFFKKLFSSAHVTIAKEKRPPLIMDPSLHPTPDYRPDYIDTCFCGSEKFFKSCCGSLEERREPPYGVFVFENYLSPEIITELTEYLNTQPSEPLRVIDNEKSTLDNVVTKLDDARRSERVIMGDYYSRVCDITRTAFVDLAEKCMNATLEWYEPPQVLRYFPGGYYQGHSDSENMEPNNHYWKKVIDRDLSLLIYLNDDFEGGELHFNKFHYTLKPKAGMAVIFPSDNRYMHTAQTVHEGMRQAIVTWGAVKGVKKISSTPPPHAFII